MRSSGRARSGACSRTRFSPCPEHRLWAVTHSALMSRDDWNGGIPKLTVRVRFPSSAFMVDRSARRIAGQGRQRDRWRGYAWSTRLGERDGAVRDAQLRAGGALLAMTDDEGLSMREAVEWCGSGVTLREVTRAAPPGDQHPGQ